MRRLGLGLSLSAQRYAAAVDEAEQFLLSGTLGAEAGGPTNGVGYIQGGDGSWAATHDWGGPFGSFDGDDTLAVLWDISGSDHRYLILRGDFSAFTNGLYVTADDGENEPLTAHYPAAFQANPQSPSHGDHWMFFTADGPLGLEDGVEYSVTVSEMQPEP